MSCAEIALQDRDPSEHGQRGDNKIWRSAAGGGVQWQVQLSGQRQKRHDIREKAGADLRHRSLPGGHLPGAAGGLRRISGDIRQEKKDPAGAESQKSGWNS